MCLLFSVNTKLRFCTVHAFVCVCTYVIKNIRLTNLVGLILQETESSVFLLVIRRTINYHFNQTSC